MKLNATREAMNGYWYEYGRSEKIVGGPTGCCQSRFPAASGAQPQTVSMLGHVIKTSADLLTNADFWPAFA
jgi:hypothetical protein